MYFNDGAFVTEQCGIVIDSRKHLFDKTPKLTDIEHGGRNAKISGSYLDNDWYGHSHLGREIRPKVH